MSERTYTVDMRDREASARTFLKMFKDGLIECRNTTPIPEELEWEIRLYDFMMEDPAARLALYQKTRMPDPVGSRILPKREVVKILGWVIP